MKDLLDNELKTLDSYIPCQLFKPNSKYSAMLYPFSCYGGRTTGCRGWESVSSRRFCVYELLLTKEKFYKGARGYVCMRTGTDPRAWIVLLYRGSCSRIMDHEVALPLRALRRGGGMDVFVTSAQNLDSGKSTLLDHG